MADITKSNVTIRYRTEYGQTPPDKAIIANESLTLEHLPILSAENHTFVKWVHINEAGHESSLSERMIISTEWLIPTDSADNFYVIFTAKWKTKKQESGGSGQDGKDGEDGATFTPSVSDNGDLSWSNNKGLPNPDTVNIKGETGKTAYEYAQDGGYTGTEEEFTALLLGNHEHNASSITSGTLPLSRGGTGAALSRTSNAIIRYSSNSAKFSSTATNNGALFATSSNGTPKFGILPVAQGGTGATTVEDVLVNLGLGNVDNTSDAEKPISTATQEALNAKANADAVPTKTSQLTNDSGFLTQHQDISGKANASDLTSHTGNNTVHITANERTAWNNKANDFSIEIYNGTSGNPKPVRFASFNYSTCGSENGIAAKISMVSGHGNGSSYAFLQDAIIRVTHTGGVTVDNFKYYGAETPTYDGAVRQYGDIFWLIDETNKIVDFYCLMGQYARMYQTPWKRLTYSTGGSVTQHTSCTVYSSGTMNWANNSEIALTSDIPSWAMKSTKPTYTASEVGALPTSGGTTTGEIIINTTSKGYEGYTGQSALNILHTGMRDVGDLVDMATFSVYETSPFGLKFKADGNGNAYIQSQRIASTTEMFPLSLNPSGGIVYVNGYPTHHDGNNARSTLVSTETNPTTNGYINWTYE